MRQERNARRRAKVEADLKSHSLPAWRPLLERGDKIATSKLGGTPMSSGATSQLSGPMSSGDDWPEGQAFLLQLLTDELPESVELPAGHVLQLFWSPSHYGPPSRGGSGLTLRFFATPAKPEPLGEVAKEGMLITGWDPFDDHPSRMERSKLGLTWNAKEARAADALSADGGLKLGGWPDWIQDTEWPEPGARLLMQLPAGLHIPADFGDSGLGYLTYVPGDASSLSFGWSST